MAQDPTTGAPHSRLQSPTVQVGLVGLIFFFVFVAYSTVQAFATKLYGPELGANMETILYSTFTVACFFGPIVTNRLGCRFTMFVGILGYAALIVASLAFSSSNNNGSFLGALVCMGGALNGVGAALLWTAQGRFMMEYSDGTDGGRLFSIFWALLNSASVVGGFLTFFYFGGNDADASTGLFVIFLVVVIVGGLLPFLLTEPPPRAAAGGSESDSQSTQNSWAAEMTATLRLFRSRRMQILSLIFLYSGLNQPYQLNTFTGRFFADKAQGLEIVVFYTFEVIGALFAGRSLDSCKPEHRRNRAFQQLAFFLVITLLGNAGAFYYEIRRSSTGAPTNMEFDQGVSVAATVTNALWGTSDAMIQSYAYWLITVSYTGGSELARATGFFKMVQSLGWTAGFLLVPEERFSAIGQLIMITVVCVAGTALALLELPKASSLCVDAPDFEKALAKDCGPEPDMQNGPEPETQKS